MFKAPERSKRRLAAELGGSLAAEAARRLLDCALEDAAQWPGPVCYAPAGREDAEWLAATLGAAPLLIEQRGVSLGARIDHVSRMLFERSHARQIFIGIDCPELDAPYLRAAAAALDGHDLAVGPAHDGGAVLIATRRPLPNLDLLPWSTPTLLNALMTLVENLGWSTWRAQGLADVDTLDDLTAAAAALCGDSRDARRAFCAWAAAAGIARNTRT